MLNEKICNDAVGVISFIVEDSDYKNAVVTNTKTGESFDAIEVLENLIKEHFTPKALKFKELHKNMWVYDVKNKCCIYIEEFTVDNQMMIIRYPMSNRDSNCEWCNFEENRFYSITIPSIGDKNG